MGGEKVARGVVRGRPEGVARESLPAPVTRTHHRRRLRFFFFLYSSSSSLFFLWASFSVACVHCPLASPIHNNKRDKSDKSDKSDK